MRSLIIAAALALAACTPQAPPNQAQQQAGQSQQQGSQQSGAVTTTPAAVQPSKPGPTEPAVAPRREVINAQFMLGRWGDNGDCNNDIVINADGSFRSYTGGEGQWTLSGDTLRLEGKNGSFDMRLELINHDTLRITNPDGSVGTSQRC